MRHVFCAGYPRGSGIVSLRFKALSPLFFVRVSQRLSIGWGGTTFFLLTHPFFHVLFCSLSPRTTVLDIPCSFSLIPCLLSPFVNGKGEEIISFLPHRSTPALGQYGGVRGRLGGSDGLEYWPNEIHSSHSSVLLKLPRKAGL